MDDALLGKLRDEKIARRLGISINAVKQRRTRLGIFLPDKLRLPRRGQRPWTASELAMLGKINDREIARRFHRWVHHVRWKRQELGIATPFLKRWTTDEEKLLGKMPDELIARQTGRTVTAVALHRQR